MIAVAAFFNVEYNSFHGVNTCTCTQIINKNLYDVTVNKIN